MAITKEMFPQFRADLAAALVDVEKKYGVKLSLGTITYTPTTFTSKMTAVSNDATPDNTEDGSVKWQAGFLKSAGRYGMKASDLGKEVTVSGVKYTIAGARPKASNPIVLRKANGSHVASAVEPVYKALYGN
ncbi:MAG: hypothetical protein EO766_12170 [Hydrotalea sp. AMD]|uniref:hypothetical protein n=1 Tax=Hydrotalea sp. AMD TaxID=2501297 RepID=UPI0010268F28|nr:hypothetical protein [Hydrotalea sp. AMD]RWZ87273.1 MAG: hypothetical protein EO766_12170 [Hydrotalea sp. AMD]